MSMQGILGIFFLLSVGAGILMPHPVFASDSSGDLSDVVTGNDVFAVALYRQISAVQEGNVFFCPYSIRNALSMAYAGADGNTARQMAKVLQLQAESQQSHQGMRMWATALHTGSDKSEGYQLHTANALWSQRGYEFLPAFRELLQAYYDGGLHDVDFAHDVEHTRETINTWITSQTEGNIVEFLPPGMLNPSTILVLTNAIYFKGEWATPFDPKKTAEAPFYLSDGEQIEVPIMSQTLSAGLLEEEGVQILELPYSGARLAMVLVLPDVQTRLASFEETLSADLVGQLLARMAPQKVMVTIPRWSMEIGISLPAVLQAMGMTDAFSPSSADFSGMADISDLYISEVFHKAVLEVNEEGTTASAATEVTMSRGLRRYPMFIADHPFVVLIRDQKTGGILFMGRVMDPRG